MFKYFLYAHAHLAQCTAQHIHVYIKKIISVFVMFFISSYIVATHSDVPAVKFRETRSRLKFLSLMSSEEALSVMEVMRVECRAAAEKRLFHTGTSKPLRLEEFDQAQQQATSQVTHTHTHTLYVVDHMDAPTVHVYMHFLCVCVKQVQNHSSE